MKVFSSQTASTKQSQKSAIAALLAISVALFMYEAVDAGNVASPQSPMGGQNLAAGGLQGRIPAANSGKGNGKASPEEFCDNFKAALNSNDLATQGTLCPKMTAECLANPNLPLANIQSSCFAQMPAEIWSSIDKAAMERIVRNSLPNLPLMGINNNGAVLMAILQRGSNDDLDSIAQSLADAGSMSAILSAQATFKPFLVGRLLTKGAVSKLTPEDCKHLQADHFKKMPVDALAEISSSCAAAIPPAVFAAAIKQLAQMNPAAFKSITKAQLAAIPPDSLKELTPDQLSQLGDEPQFKELDQQGTPEDLERTRRENAQVATRHPCIVFKDTRSGYFSPNAYRNLEARCKVVWENRSMRSTVTLSLVLAVLGAVLWITI